MIKVLVTGAGALLGQGIIRALRRGNLAVEIIAVDPGNLSAGLYWADRAYLVELASSKNYLDSIKRILGLERPDVVLVGTDVELLTFAEQRAELEEQYHTKILVSSPRVVEIANDKYLTYQFLREQGLPCPVSCLPGEEEELIEQVGFPLIVKPRVGARSYGVQLVNHRSDLQQAIRQIDSPVIQECVGDATQEYTTGVLCFDEHLLGCITMRRELRDGNTYRAYTGSYPELDRMMLEVAKRLKPYGPVNFQFRCDRAGVPKIFEINARFSGTTPLRARAGFDEVEMALRLLQLGERDFNPQIRPLVFLRHWSETIITPQQLEQIEQLDPTPLDSEPDIARVELGGSSAGLI